MKLSTILTICFLLFSLFTSLYSQTYLLLPMDEAQVDHLRAYGVSYHALKKGFNVEWLLNYRGGSFLLPNSDILIKKAKELSVTYEIIGNTTKNNIYNIIKNNNMERLILEKAPKIAIYKPPYAERWDDAVELALNYAQIPYDTLWIDEVLRGDLQKYDWLHLHHEDFTGQFSKFYYAFKNESWFRQQMLLHQQAAARNGFTKISKCELQVAKKIKEFVKSGKLLFAMCCAPDTLDIALAAEKTDILPVELDGDPIDPDYQKKLDFTKTLAFENFQLDLNLYNYELSDIDVRPEPLEKIKDSYFTLFSFYAKYDPILTMLCQNHTNHIRDFLGKTTSFNRKTLKKNVIILGEVEGTNRVKYIHGNYGEGAFTFYAGHDPEDYAHLVGEAPTDLSYHKNSPGYRLILNNIFFPAARKEKKKT